MSLWHYCSMSLAQDPRASHSPAWHFCVPAHLPALRNVLEEGLEGRGRTGDPMSVVLMSASREGLSFSPACAVSLWPGWWELLGPGGLPRLPLS